MTGATKPLAAARTAGARIGVALWAIPAIFFVLFAALRLLGVAGNRFIVATIALTPYIAVIGLVLGAIGLLMRRWIFGGIVMAIALIVAAGIVPRLVTNDQPVVYGPKLVVMSANLHLGQADVQTVLDQVKQNDVDVLSLQELTPDFVRQLERGGINNLLPYRLFEAEAGGSGSGLASKYPLDQVQLADRASFAQPSAIVDLPGVVDPDVMAVHTMPGIGDQSNTTWKRELDELPGTEPQVRPRLLVGDFNATLDHPGLRDVLSRGYADAGERRGAGLVPTWPAGLWPPPVTIDHVLVDNRATVEDYRVVDLPGSDHRVVLAWLTLP